MTYTVSSGTLNSTIPYLHQTGSVGEDSDHLQLIKFWPSRAPGKGVYGWAKIFGSARLAYYSQRAVFARLWALFFIYSGIKFFRSSSISCHGKCLERRMTSSASSRYRQRRSAVRIFVVQVFVVNCLCFSICQLSKCKLQRRYCGQQMTKYGCSIKRNFRFPNGSAGIRIPYRSALSSSTWHIQFMDCLWFIEIETFWSPKFPDWVLPFCLCRNGCVVVNRWQVVLVAISTKMMHRPNLGYTVAYIVNICAGLRFDKL